MYCENFRGHQKPVFHPGPGEFWYATASEHLKVASGLYFIYQSVSKQLQGCFFIYHSALKLVYGCILYVRAPKICLRVVFYLGCIFICRSVSKLLQGCFFYLSERQSWLMIVFYLLERLAFAWVLYFIYLSVWSLLQGCILSFRVYYSSIKTEHQKVDSG